MNPEISTAVNDNEMEIAKSHFNRYLGVYIATLLSVLVAFAGWACVTFVEVRDTVIALKQTVPIQFNMINARLDSLEHSVDKQNDRIDTLERSK
jgi:hypothetical protein